MLNLLTFPWTSDHNQHWLSRMLGKSTGNPEQGIGCYALGVCADLVATTLEGCLPNNPISGLEARQLADRLTRITVLVVSAIAFAYFARSVVVPVLLA